MHHASPVPLRTEAWLYRCRQVCLHFPAGLCAEARQRCVTVGASAVMAGLDARWELTLFIVEAAVAGKSLR